MGLLWSLQRGCMWETAEHAFHQQVTVGCVAKQVTINTWRPRQNGCHFADNIFLNENVEFSIEISLKIVPEGPIDNIPALVQRMAWRQLGDKPLSEPMMVSLLMHICVTRPQWVDGCMSLGCITDHDANDIPILVLHKNLGDMTGSLNHKFDCSSFRNKCNTGCWIQ